MTLSRLRARDWCVALGCGLWVGVFVWPVTGWATALAVTTAGVLLLARHAPVATAVLIAALHVVGALALGVPSENPAGLAALLVTTYSLGRYSRAVVGIPAAGLCTVVFVATSFSFESLVFAALVVGGTVTFGWLVRRRSSSESSALSLAFELEQADASRLTLRMVADERARIGWEALAVIRSSVEAMGAGAAAARSTLDEPVIAAIADRGRAAVTELRWLLGLLRAEPDVVVSSKRGHRTLVVDVIVGLIAVMLTVLDGQLAGAAISSLGWTLLVALSLTLVGRRTRPLLMTIAAAIVVGLIALAGSALIIGTGGGVLITVGLLAWTVGARGGWLMFGALLALVGSTLAWFVLHDVLENVPMMVAVFAVPAFAGHEWAVRDRTARSAEARVAFARADLDATVNAAVRAERLRIARDLHDVTSHAVGVMVLQASAALALLGSDPDGARRALQTVESMSAQAGTELMVLVDVLGVGSIGASGPGRPGSESVAALVERMSAAGLDASARLAPVPARLESTVYRLVQEALTNVMRHAPGARVEVLVSEYAAGIEVCVVDAGVERTVEGPSHGFSSGFGHGFGLDGLAERVHALGGAFSCGPVSTGGFRVWARLPDQAAEKPVTTGPARVGVVPT